MNMYKKNKRWLLNQKLQNSYLSNKPLEKEVTIPQLPVLDLEGNVVPKNPHQFYLWLGKIYHPLNKQLVDSYASYQLKGWKMQLESDTLVVKSNKVGYSSSSLDALIQNCLL